MFNVKKPAATPEERAAAAKIRDQELETFCRYPDAETDAKIRSRAVVTEIPELWNLTLAYLSEGERRSDRVSRRETSTRTHKTRLPKSKADGPPKARLSQADEDGLRFYFSDFPATCGLRSNWQSTVEAMGECAKCGAAHELPTRRKLCAGCRQPIGSFHYESYMRVKAEGSSAWHPNVDANMLGLVSSGEVERANKIRDVLVAMVDAGYSKDVTVLYRVYGEQNRCAMFLQFGILAQIVEYTRVVEKYATEKGVTPRAYLENRLSGGKDSVFKAAVTMSAEALLRQAESRYVQCK